MHVYLNDDWSTDGSKLFRFALKNGIPLGMYSMDEARLYAANAFREMNKHEELPSRFVSIVVPTIKEINSEEYESPERYNGWLAMREKGVTETFLEAEEGLKICLDTMATIDILAETYQGKGLEVVGGEIKLPKEHTIVI